MINAHPSSVSEIMTSVGRELNFGFKDLSVFKVTRPEYKEEFQLFQFVQIGPGNFYSNLIVIPSK